MKKLVHRLLNLILYIAFCSMVGTGLLLAYRLPPGSSGGRGFTVLGMERHEWGNVHLWIAYIVVVAVFAHLGMNWTWLMKIAASMKPLRLWVGLLVGIGIIVVLLIFPVNTERLLQGQGHRRIHQSQED